jgi:tetraacyldisaccharide 4'-kinase
MSRIFGTFVKTRTHLYDTGWLPIRRLNHPVISVGNLTLGGTGKTPLVIELATQFRNLGYRPVVLSRGYRRRSRGIVVVSRGEGPEVGWSEAGDEPSLIAIRLPGVAVVVGADRHQAGLFAESAKLGDLFILDDGFQHRRLHRDVDLVTIDPVDWAEKDRLLPRGRWREPRTALNRAQAALVHESDVAPVPHLSVPSFGVETLVDGIVKNGNLIPPDSLAGTPLSAFAGIAKPERFFRALYALGLRPHNKKIFPDHHIYSPRDLSNLGSGACITTEKDAVRLPENDFYFLRISAKIRRFEALRDLILERINGTP